MTDGPTHRVFTTRSDFVDALRFGLAIAARDGSREVWLADPDFADWPLDEREVLDALTRWALPHRRLTMLANGFDEVARRFPRFVEWRRQWSHVIDCRRPEDDAPPLQMPTVLLLPERFVVRLFDREQWRGSVSRDAADALRCRELVDAISQRCADAFPPTTLGL